MTDQEYKPRQQRMIYYYKSPSILYLLVLLFIVLTLVTCSSLPSTSSQVSVQPALPTPTLEPTFTPSPSPTDTLISSPTAMPESTPTSLPQVSLSGRILDQATGRPLAGVMVNVGKETVATDDDGHYALTDLPPGQYILSATHDDYDPGLSAILTLAVGEELEVDLTLYEPDTSPYPQDPMLTNPLDPNGAPTEEDAERLAREQGLTGKVVSIEETTLSGEYLVNYKIGDDIRAAVAALKHEAWELTDETGHKWWIIKVCGNLASHLPEQAPIATPAPKSLPPMAEIRLDGAVLRSCASEDCSEFGIVRRGNQVEVLGCLADSSWCEVDWSGGRGWCTGRSLMQLAVAEAVPVVQAVLPTVTPAGQLPQPVETLQIKFTPETLTIPVGFSNCFNIAGLSAWDRKVLPTWSVAGLPTQVTSQFTGAGYGVPTSGCLQIKTSTSASEGIYPVQIIATVPGMTWLAAATLKIIACEEFEPGIYADTMDKLKSVIVAGKPDSRYGLMIPLLVCDYPQPRKFITTIESAISEAGTTLLEPPRIYLFRSLVFPAPDGIHAHNPVYLNVEHEYATTDDWSLEAEVTSGLYLLVFEHHSLMNPREPKDIPQLVTYRVEIVDIP